MLSRCLDDVIRFFVGDHPAQQFEGGTQVHFTNNRKTPTRGEPMYDRLGKVRPVIDNIGSALASSYIPGRDVVVKEANIVV